MSDVELQGQDAEACPKRVWVMLTLSDDEALQEGESLPQGLQFHLSRCESCRAVAEHLQAVSASLRGASVLEPPDGLAARADAQVREALQEGARLTGRVAIPDEPEPVRQAGGARRWVRIGRYAAAAAVFIAVGLFGLAQLPKSAQQTTDQTAGQPQPSDQHNPEAPRLADSEEPEPLDAVDLLPEAEDEAEAVADSRLASSDAGRSTRRARSRQICRHRSYVEAALSEDTDCIPRAVILPDPGQRDLGWGNTLFDRSRSTRSTRGRSDDR